MVTNVLDDDVFETLVLIYLSFAETILTLNINTMGTFFSIRQLFL